MCRFSIEVDDVILKLRATYAIYQNQKGLSIELNMNYEYH